MNISSVTEAAPVGVLEPGQVIGGALIEAHIGSGGMGLVYRARKLLLDRTVAVKILRPERACVPSLLARFLREGKIAASLDHANIVTVFDVGEEGGRYFIVMELVEGTNLLDLVQSKGPVASKDVMSIARQVAEALAYAHERGVIHRDIKPGNILLTKDGAVKVADLGLARPIREDTEVTNPGQVIGTPVYMAPEQCRSGPIDTRTDLYSLGATLYMLLAGKPPFRADSTAALVHRVVNEPPRPLKSAAPETPDKVVALVQRLMAKHPVARYQTAREVIEAIDEIVTSRFRLAGEMKKEPAQVSVHAVRPQSGGATSRGAVLFLIAAAFAAAGYMFHASANPTPSGAAEPSTASASPRSSPPAAGSAKPQIPEPESAARGGDEVAPGSPLSASLVTFRNAIASDDMNGLLACFEPDVRSSARLRSALEELVQGCRARSLEPGSPLVQSEDASSAATVIFFHSKKDAKTLGIPVEWYRKDERWYARPRTYSFPE